MATREVRDLLVSVGREADCDTLCDRVATATASLARCQPALMTRGVRDMLVVLGSRVGPSEYARGEIAEAIAAMARESNQAVESTAQAAQDMETLAGQLQQTVSRFHV